jgi:hypothetical protein
MIPIMFAVGVCLYDARVISNPGKKAFVSIRIECTDARMKWPKRMDCMLFPRMGEDINVLASQYRVGALVCVTGEPSAQAYTGKDGKVRGQLSVYCKEISVIGAAPAASTPEGDQFDDAAAAFDEPRPVRPPAPPGAYDPLSRPSPLGQRRRNVPQLVEPPPSADSEPY